MPKITALVLLIILSGCEQRTSTAERAEVADVNARNALQRQRELEERVDDLEERVVQIENR